MEDTPDMLRAKNATQILNEVKTVATYCMHILNMAPAYPNYTKKEKK